MRDSNAPIINGYDCSGLVNRYSFRCEQSFPERGDTARLLDGASQTDVFPRKIRLSWTINSVTAQRFADFNTALDASDTINLVSAVAYDPTRDALCSGLFHVTRPAFPFALAVNGSPISQAGAELILEQQGALDWISVTPPTKLAYDIGDTFDSAGFRVTLTDDKDSVTDITSACSLTLSDGTTLADGDWLLAAGNVAVSVIRDGVKIGEFALSVTGAEDWWIFNENTNLLYIYCVGEIPSYTATRDIPWHEHMNDISTVIISDSVTSIGNASFTYCSCVRVDIPKSVTSIGNSAFSHCSRLSFIPPNQKFRRIDIPDSVTSIGNYAFYECSAVQMIYIPDSVTFIGTAAFQWCNALVSVHLGSGVASIPNNAFWGCTKLSGVDIPSGVTSIEHHAFCACPSLKNIVIPDSVTSIGEEAFEQTRLKAVTISRNCTVGRNAFPPGCVISYYEDEEAAP